jgi:hypothetical protein
MNRLKERFGDLIEVARALAAKKALAGWSQPAKL